MRSDFLHHFLFLFTVCPFRSRDSSQCSRHFLTELLDQEDRKAAAASDPESSLNESLMADSGGEVRILQLIRF